MDATPTQLLKLLLPKTPLLLRTALAHTLSLSPQSSKWDLRTAITVSIMRDMMGPNSTPTSITHQQKLTTRDPGVKGPMWISKVALDALPDDEVNGVRDVLLRAIKELGTGNETYSIPNNAPCEGEWTGYRAGVAANEPEPTGLSEQQKYDNLLKETTSKVTVLYFHGGAMYLLDPSTSRPNTARIARETGGQAFSVRYRLSPQHPFPAALLDALTSYLTLLYPPPTAPHTAIPANEIVFSGDSAGGTLCTSLLQLLLHLHRQSPNPTVSWYEKDVAIPLPAGLALSSPWLDITRSMPSITHFAQNDYLPPVTGSNFTTRFPACEAWPAKPPRADLYCEASALMHPLVSPLAARDWSASPPLFFSLGEEMLRDEDAVMAQRAAKQGVKVVWREFEALPHCFGMMLEGLGATRVHYEELGGFCRDVVGGKEVETSAEFLKAKTLERVQVDVKGLCGLSDEEVEALMRKGVERISGGRKGEMEGRPML
ncbi:hypothetical protein M011DRAFT_467017 [Sporormia fimetaria CBS 119925]|uniref:Alpha/beta hydrolase fold-3 domain-containing protein n=1 Tax=Sporormia fimetaria CBS 119925 TaxID=1340428 RepID=A0A6A6VEK1_9PLEO|nr:hypothetical protein M011DRAFT_467017 [Sporormia fimetaria CBS 119925]